MKYRPLWLTCAALVTVAATLGGCGSSGTPMMGQRGGQTPSARSGFPAGMMHSFGSGYHARGLVCAAPSLPGRLVTVVVGDMGMTSVVGGTAQPGGHMMLRALPASVPSGQIGFVVDNMGWRTHELVVLPLAAGHQAGERVPGPDGRIDEAGSLGEASASCASGAGEGISSGSVGWVVLRLPAGRYELVCNLPHHYASGMYQAFDVA
ncbi:MAG: hypothetical protein NTV23_03175 [Propionibacteriales bacterium]|nr:hypothetical protein [Propionibacteriales bacterium]